MARPSGSRICVESYVAMDDFVAVWFLPCIEWMLRKDLLHFLMNQLVMHVTRRYFSWRIFTLVRIALWPYIGFSSCMTLTVFPFVLGSQFFVRVMICWHQESVGRGTPASWLGTFRNCAPVSKAPDYTFPAYNWVQTSRFMMRSKARKAD